MVGAHYILHKGVTEIYANGVMGYLVHFARPYGPCLKFNHFSALPLGSLTHESLMETPLMNIINLSILTGTVSYWSVVIRKGEKLHLSRRPSMEFQSGLWRLAILGRKVMGRICQCSWWKMSLIRAVRNEAGFLCVREEMNTKLIKPKSCDECGHVST